VGTLLPSQVPPSHPFKILAHAVGSPVALKIVSSSANEGCAGYRLAVLYASRRNSMYSAASIISALSCSLLKVTELFNVRLTLPDVPFFVVIRTTPLAPFEP